jgi:Zn-dependent protease
MVFTLWEIIQIGITILSIGFIFSGFIKKPKLAHNYVEDLLGEHNFMKKFFNWDDIKYAIAVVAPAIILHEFGHKFVGLAMGYMSYYEMFPLGLGIGIFLRLVGSGFILFAPGYVVVPTANVVHMGIIAFAGPLVNIILFGASWAMLESGKFRKYARYLWITKTINLWLFAFNMIPFGPLDGAKVLAAILSFL